MPPPPNPIIAETHERLFAFWHSVHDSPDLPNLARQWDELREQFAAHNIPTSDALEVHCTIALIGSEIYSRMDNPSRSAEILQTYLDTSTGDQRFASARPIYIVTLSEYKLRNHEIDAAVHLFSYALASTRSRQTIRAVKLIFGGAVFRYTRQFPGQRHELSAALGPELSLQLIPLDPEWEDAVLILARDSPTFTAAQASKQLTAAGTPHFRRRHPPSLAAPEPPNPKATPRTRRLPESFHLSDRSLLPLTPQQITP